MSTILFLQYNNYFNRIIKKEDSLSAYKANRNYKLFQSINWNPNDGVTTEGIFNWKENWNPDYCIELTDEEQIKSRWFITEQRRTRGCQYSFSFKRDTIADNYLLVLNSPTFIERAMLEADDPLIFNPEGITLNQIKKSETLLTDKSKMSYIALYLAPGTTADTTKLTGNYSTVDPEDIGAYDIGTTLDNWSIYQNYIVDGQGYKNPISKGIRTYCDVNIASTGFPSLIHRKTKFDSNYNGEIVDTESLGIVELASLNYGNTLQYARTAIQTRLQSNISNIQDEIDEIANPEDTLEEIRSYSIIKTSDDKYYRIKVEAKPSLNDTVELEVTDSVHSSLYTELYEAFRDSEGFIDRMFSGEIDSETFKMIYSYEFYSVSAEEIINLSGTYDLHGSFNTCKDAPYEVICLPYSTTENFLTLQGYGPYAKKLDFEISRFIANDIIKRGTSGNWLYDAQLIPLCPLEVSIFTSITEHGLLYNRVDLSSLSNSQYLYINKVEEETSFSVGFCLYLDSINFTKNLYYQLEIGTDRTESENIKIENETRFYRLCSPNYNGQFEFNVAKNGGVDFFNVDCTLIPYQPYIHVNPNFKKLYGSDFNDCRGLICGGDFSLSQMTDAWLSYQAQNKNYQNIFNRQIENMDVMNKFQKASDIISIISGSTTGAASGAFAGSVGGPVGAAVGGLVGGAASVAGGIADFAINQAKFRESKDYATDIHNYQLANVQALPNSLTRVSSINANNKIFIVLEEYSCTDKEIEILVNKIKYESMTVGRIDLIKNYQLESPSFIRGQVIRLDDLGEDSHLAQDIYNEISKGVYI